MSKLKIVLSAVLIAVVSLGFVACGGNKQVKDLGVKEDASGVYPKEIEKLLKKEYKESITAVGRGSSHDENTALKKARMDATVQIATEFNKEVALWEKSFLESVNDSQVDDYRQTAEVFALVTLSGDKIVKEMTAKGKDGYTAWVLRALDVSAFKNMMDDQKNAATVIKANAAYKALEDRVEREKAARALAE